MGKKQFLKMLNTARIINKKDSVPISESLSVEEALSTVEEADQVHGNLPPESLHENGHPKL